MPTSELFSFGDLPRELKIKILREPGISYFQKYLFLKMHQSEDLLPDTVNYQNLVEQFFPASFHYTLCKKSLMPETSIDWRKLFFNNMLQLTQIHPNTKYTLTKESEKLKHLLRPLLFAAMQENHIQFKRILENLLKNELNFYQNFLRPSYALQKFLEIIVRCEPSIKNILYNCVKEYYGNLFPLSYSIKNVEINLFLFNDEKLYWSLLDWAIVCDQTDEVEKLTTSTNIALLFNIEKLMPFFEEEQNNNQIRDVHLSDKEILIYKNQFINTRRIALTYGTSSVVSTLAAKINQFLLIRTKFTQQNVPTPLQIAFNAKNVSVFELLLNLGQALDKQSTPSDLLIASISEKNTLFMNLLFNCDNLTATLEPSTVEKFMISGNTPTLDTTLMSILLNKNFFLEEEIREKILVQTVRSDLGYPDTVKLVSLLLEQNVNPNTPSARLNAEQKIQEAIQQNKPSHIREELEQQRQSPIIHAALKNNQAILKMLLAHGAILSADILITIKDIITGIEQSNPNLSKEFKIKLNKGFKWLNEFYYFTNGTPKQCAIKLVKHYGDDFLIPEIKTQGSFFAKKHLDNAFLRDWFNSIKQRNVQSWAGLLSTMETALQKASSNDDPKLKQCIILFKQIMAHTAIKVEIEQKTMNKQQVAVHSRI